MIIQFPLTNLCILSNITFLWTLSLKLIGIAEKVISFSEIYNPALPLSPTFSHLRNLQVVSLSPRKLMSSARLPFLLSSTHSNKNNLIFESPSPRYRFPPERMVTSVTSNYYFSFLSVHSFIEYPSNFLWTGCSNVMMTCDDGGHFFATLYNPGRRFPRGFQTFGVTWWLSGWGAFGPKNQKNSTFNEGGDYPAVYLDPSFLEIWWERGGSTEGFSATGKGDLRESMTLWEY